MWSEELRLLKKSRPFESGSAHLCSTSFIHGALEDRRPEMARALLLLCDEVLLTRVNEKNKNNVISIR